MAKVQIQNYTFNAAAKTVTFTDYASIRLDSVLLITNVTFSNIIIYQFNVSTLGGTVATNVLTLTYNTAAMSNTDKLQIWYQDGNNQAVTVADGADVAEGSTTDAAVSTDTTGTISGKLRGLVKLLAAWIGTLGQKTMANSAPVVIASDQSAVPISGTITATPTGTQDVNLKQVNGQTVDVGTGAAGTGTQRVTTSTDSTVQVVGNVAHDGIDSGNPVKVGNKAIAFGANPTAVASGDRTDAYANVAGIQFVLGGHPNIITFEAAYTSAQTDASIVTISTGNKIVVTEVEALCDNANTVNVGVRVGFGTASTPTTTGVVLTHPGIAPGSGVVRGNGSGILGVGADNEDLRVTSQVPTGGSLRILVSYFTIAV